MTSRVVVTGAAGFIGRWVIKELIDRDLRVHGIDNLSNGYRRNIAALDSSDRFEFVEGDVRDSDLVAEVIDGDTEACIHLAAEIDVQQSLVDPQSHFQTNVVGTQNVLEACRKTDSALALVGTCMVYDLADSEAGIDESHPVKPASPYAGSKLAAENLAESYYHGYGLPVTLLRPFNTYGPFQKTSMEGGVVSIFTQRDIEGKPLKVFGSGTQTRDLMYVTDCARFVVDAALSDEAVGEYINAGTGSDISIRDLAQLIATESTEIEHVEHHHPQSEVQKLLCDPTKAEELLGWEPRVSLEQGIDRVREWMTDRSHD